MNNEIDVLKQAYQNEIEGYEFYRMGADSTDDKENKAVFEKLANEELLHADYLLDLADKIGGKKAELELDMVDFKPTDPEIYNWNRFDDTQAKRAMTIFNVARGLEEEAIRFYEDAYAKSENEEAKQIYKILAAW
ncbi:MAG: ferritin family protein, partial [Gallicola sp.]|nr:ferritin family protein [Gallicola sp.]